MSVHDPIAAVSRSRSGTEPNASCTHRLYPRAARVPHVEGPDPVRDVVREVVGAQVAVVHDLGGDALAVHLREAHVEVVDPA